MQTTIATGRNPGFAWSQAVDLRIAFVILARDEARTIGDTVRSVVGALAADDRLFVVADNCSDDTVHEARAADARVVVRDNGASNGKGEALGWFLRRHADELQRYSMLAVLDADTTVSPDFVERVRVHIRPESAALQCVVWPVYDPDVPVSMLAAFSELLEQQVSNRLRTRLGWPVRLRGTGMLIRPALLIEASRRLDTKVEDLALSLLLAAQGVRIEQVDEARVFDPKPDSARAAAIQRARWFRGQCQALWQYRREIARVLLRGPGGWALLSALFLRPKWLVLAASLVLALVCLPWPWLSLAWGAYFLASLGYLIAGLRLLPERPALGAVLVRAPAFVFMWIRGILLSARSSAWHRVRH